jgi:hypothetical protein
MFAGVAAYNGYGDLIGAGRAAPGRLGVGSPSSRGASIACIVYQLAVLPAVPVASGSSTGGPINCGSPVTGPTRCCAVSMGTEPPAGG